MAEDSAVVAAFLKLTGYKARDVHGHNDRSRIVVTTNGGKYELDARLRQVRVLSGPTPPSAKAVVEEPEQKEPAE